jgi:hypothetical protein
MGTAMGMLAVLLLAGCSITNEGTVNYRKQGVTVGRDNKKELHLVKKYSLSNESDDNVITTENKISIHLVQGFVKSFPELVGIFKAESSKTKRGEIAVVVKAYELKSDNMLAFDADVIDTGRLVYYSDDVNPGQYLNFSYLPVYGPVQWTGYPIVLQIYIIELDDNEQIKPLLHTLAGLGSMLYAPAAPVLTVLDKLGSALLNGSHDDIIFRYHMTFYPTGGFKELGYPVLEAANYVLMRHEDRQTDFNWTNIYLDTDEGRLRSGAGKDAPFFRDETYLVFQIQKNFSFDLDPSKAVYYKNFVEKLRTNAANNATNIGKALSDAANDITNDSNYQKLMTLANRVQTCISDSRDYIKNLVFKYVSRLAEEITDKDKCTGSSKKYGCLTMDQIDSLVAVLQNIAPTASITSETIVRNKNTVIDAVVNAKMEQLRNR